MTLQKRAPLVAVLVAVLLLFNELTSALASSPAPSAVKPGTGTTAPYANKFVPAPNATRVYFPDCGHYLGMGFLYFWRQNGKSDQLGCPISEEMNENGRTVQYFQKARLEYHPDLAGTQWETSLGLLGTELANATPETKTNPAFNPIAPFASTPDRVYFDVTKHSLGGGFYQMWQARGGVYFSGYPISEEYPLQVDGLWVSAQDFERTRFLYHPSFGVKVADLGLQVAGHKTINTAALPQDPQVPVVADNLWEHWVDVNLSTFTANFMEGDVPVRTVLTVPGKAGHETPVGTFKIWLRVANEHMKGGEIGTEDYYDLYNVLYTQYFTYQGHALHYAWWRSTFGYPGSHGCVNMNLDDSLFAWNFLDIGSRVNIHY